MLSFVYFIPFVEVTLHVQGKDFYLGVEGIAISCNSPAHFNS
jgi:hypothetical protein